MNPSRAAPSTFPRPALRECGRAWLCIRRRTHLGNVAERDNENGEVVPSGQPPERRACLWLGCQTEPADRRRMRDSSAHCSRAASQRFEPGVIALFIHTSADRGGARAPIMPLMWSSEALTAIHARFARSPHIESQRSLTTQYEPGPSASHRDVGSPHLANPGGHPS